MPYEARNKAIETYKLITSSELLCNKAPSNLIFLYIPLYIIHLMISLELFLEFCKYIRELRDGESIDYVGLIASLKMVISNQDSSPNPADLKSKFNWLNHEKFEDFIKTYQINSVKNSPAASPTNKSPTNKGLSTFSKAAAALNNNEGGSPSNKNINGADKYNNQLKLEKITEENEISEKKKSVLDKINQFNKNSEFVFKNCFSSSPPRKSSDIIKKMENNEEFEEGGSPNKNDYAMFQGKKDVLTFSNILKEL